MADFDETEKRFESDIESYLLSEGGYIKGTTKRGQSTYDQEKAIDLPVLVEFIKKTQPKEWKKQENRYGDRAAAQLYNRFQDEVSSYGIIHVLRHGFKDLGAKFKLVYFAPASGLNDDLVKKYEANILTCTRQFAYSTKNNDTIDMVLSVNGIPLFALELKNQFKNQSVEESKTQWMEDRDPRELLFRFDTRILTYFAVDLYNVYMTTQLAGTETRFLPFNQGSNGAGNIGDGGNPENPKGYVTSYLWERILTRETLLALLQRYISRVTEEIPYLDANKKIKTKEITYIIFPRYHQFDVVEKLVKDTKAAPKGRNFLIQHSAGSGKSNSIAWLTYRLASLHNELDEPIFKTVLVVTDRRNLNEQLRNTVLGFDHQESLIETIGKEDTSDKLRQAIDDGKRIIITTLQRFPLIYSDIKDHAGAKFAVVVDEAHSSQSGKSAEKLKAALADTDQALREFAEAEEKDEETIREEMDKMTEVLLTQGRHDNLFFYAFTATPKPKTLQAFGELQADGSYTAYHHYSMRQAIAEGFIKDVLQYYTTIETSYEIAKTVKENPEYEEPPAASAIRAYHDSHEVVLQQKIQIIVEKIREITLKKIGGKAKAMVVSPSRAHAVKYYLMMRDYCKSMGYDDIKPLVAFSGSVKIGDSEEYTEPKLNKLSGTNVSESGLPLFFASDLFNVLIVADKYQTGFDEPKLHTMFVDKKLRGVKAVQTLSRLNRDTRGKEDTYVLDFKNTEEEIQAAFQPFYEDTALSKGVELNMVYKYHTELMKFHLWAVADEEKVFKVWNQKIQGPKELGKLSGAFKPTLANYELLGEEEKFKVRYLLKNFVRFYHWLTNEVRTFDAELFKSALFAEHLFDLIPKTPHEKIDLSTKIALVNNKLNETFSGQITLQKGGGKPLEPENGGQGKKKETPRDLLSNIIDKINVMYAGQFTEADRVIVENIFDRISQVADKTLRKQARASDPKMFAEGIFPKEFNKVAISCFKEQHDSFKKLFEDKEFYNRVCQEMAKTMYLSLKGSD